MKKTCIFIIGTNGVGKTTLAKEFINEFGGIKELSRNLTICNDGETCLAGFYNEDKKYGGVDGLNSTKVLEQIVDGALSKYERIICEGSFLNSFGINLTNAIFRAEKQLVVFLYAPISVLNKRLSERSGNKISQSVINKQNGCLRSARKWAQIGVPVLSFDTSKTGMSLIVESIKERLK